MLSDRQQEMLFKRLAADKSNYSCADCRIKGAAWTSVDFGVFICINCSGSHRSFGMHITRVRSTKLDSWNLEDAKIMEVVGNKTANSYFEEGCPNKFSEGGSLSFGSSEQRRRFIKQKYVDKMFVRSDRKNPVEVLKESDFQIKKQELFDLFSGEISQQKSVGSNKKKKINFGGLSKKKSSKTKTQRRSPIENNSGNSDLLNFDVDFNPSFKKTNKTVFKKKPVKKSKDEDLLEFDLLGDFNPQPKVKTTNQAPLNLIPTNYSQKKVSSNPAWDGVFGAGPNGQSNQVHKNQDKYNCLSFASRPRVTSPMFLSNQSPSNWGDEMDSSQKYEFMTTKINSNRDVGRPLKSSPAWSNANQTRADTRSDKYAVFDYCKGYSNQGFLN